MTARRIQWLLPRGNFELSSDLRKSLVGRVLFDEPFATCGTELHHRHAFGACGHNSRHHGGVQATDPDTDDRSQGDSPAVAHLCP
ncbi:hypothetical protein ABT124_43540 [Streptomyces sp. NPDC001982]|uniref:hypothetical protein n=1 Tax=Streptomyces sp. NPDC001982 TaxID=3154405 RepID=UPI00332C0BBC